jgi:maltose/moltooligosaccharide transporter
MNDYDLNFEKCLNSDDAPLLKRHVVGTLSYDRNGLFRLFGWLFWGDIAFTFFESIFSRFMPIYLKDMHASNTLIGVMTGSIAGIVNVLFLPNISQWSDSFRSRLGRRIPFLLVVTPVTAGFLVLVGFAPDLGNLLWPMTAHFTPGLSAGNLGLAILCVCVVMYHFFNMVLVNAFNWLVRDVVPESVMPRFISWFRVIQNSAAVLFLWYIFPHMEDNRRATCLGVGAFILISFYGMCWGVKEGVYPVEPPQSNFLVQYGVYFRNCLTKSIYRNFFIAYLLVTIAGASSAPFITLFATNDLHLTVGAFGSYMACSTIVSTIIYAFMGFFCERYTSIRVMIAGLVALAITSLASYFLVTNERWFMIYSVFLAIPTVAYWLGLSVITMGIFPPDKFAQMSSGMNVFACGALIVGNLLIGQMFDYIRGAYSMVFIWCAIFYGLALIPTFALYREWRFHGGPSNYVPPQPH